MQATGSLPAACVFPFIYDHIPVRVTPAKAGAPKIKGTPLRPAQWGRGDARERALFSHWGPRHACVVGESRSSEVSEF